MKVPSSIVTLLVGFLIALIVAILSVRANSISTHPYSVAVTTAVLR
jgi:hypothetical protein